MSDSWKGDASPLTLETIARAMEQMSQRDTEREASVGRNVRAFLAATPSHLRDHPTVQTILAVILSDQPIHPDEHALLRAAYSELVSGAS